MTLANSLWSDVPTYVGERALRGDALATGQDERDRWDTAGAELASMGWLRDDWDGEGAKAPPASVLESAIHAFRKFQEAGLPAPSSIVASPNGAIVFTWETATAYREAEISQPGRISWMSERDGRPTRHWEE